MTPQAIRPPLLPVGSVFSSSAWAWMTRLVPLSPKSEPGTPGLSVTTFVVASRLAVPTPVTMRLGRSPACAPSGLSRPCFLPVGLKWAPADTKSGGSQDEHTSELQSRGHLVCRLLLEKKKNIPR